MNNYRKNNYTSPASQQRDYAKSRQPKKPAKKQMPVWQMVVIDVLATGIFLMVFSYFHHINPMGGEVEAQPLPVPTVTDDNNPAKRPLETDGGGVDTPQEPNELPVAVTPEHTDTKYVNENVSVNVYSKTKDGYTYHVADIQVRDVKYLKTAFAGGKFGRGNSYSEFLPDLAKAHNAFVAINGDQYGYRDEGIVVRNGELYRETAFHDVCVINYDGTMQTFLRNEFNINDIKKNGAWQVWAFGPLLLTDGQPMESFSEPKVNPANPRSAIGMIDKNHFIFVAVDGRGESKGVTLKGLSQLMFDLNCKVAYNLDGGATSSLVVNGKTYSTPSGDRKVTDMIYIEIE